MNYRKATIKDYHNLCLLRQQLKEHEDNWGPTEYAPYNEKRDQPWIKRCLRARKIAILIAEENNTIYAHAIILIEKVSPKIARYYTYRKKATIVHLYVDIHKRRQKIGTNLMKYTLQYLKKQRVDFIDLECHVNNHQAPKLYDKLDFQNVWIKKRLVFSNK